MWSSLNSIKFINSVNSIHIVQAVHSSVLLRDHIFRNRAFFLTPNYPKPRLFIRDQNLRNRNSPKNEKLRTRNVKLCSYGQIIGRQNIKCDHHSLGSEYRSPFSHYCLGLAISRFTCCVLLALSWNTTNENPSTVKLCRAINYVACHVKTDFPVVSKLYQS